MFEIIDHKDFATVRLMDGGSQMQFEIKKKTFQEIQVLWLISFR